MKKILPFILVFCWVTPVSANGLYLGGYVDYGKTNISVAQLMDMDSDGFLGGIYGGYDISMGRFFIGVEGDMSFGNQQETINVIEDGALVDLTESVKGLNSLRGRLGLNLGTIQIYGTAGLAWAKLEKDVKVTSGGMELSSNISETIDGWVVGGGIERAFSRNLVMRGEMLHYNFEDEFDISVEGGVLSMDSELGSTIGRFGISYKF